MSSYCYFKFYEPEEALDVNVVKLLKKYDNYKKGIWKKYGGKFGLATTLEPEYSKRISKYEEKLTKEYEKLYTGDLNHHLLEIGGKSYYSLYQAYNKKAYSDCMNWTFNPAWLYCFREKDIHRLPMYTDEHGDFYDEPSEGRFLDDQMSSVIYRTTIREAINCLNEYKTMFEAYNNLYDFMENDIDEYHSHRIDPESPQFQKLDTTEITDLIKNWLSKFGEDGLVVFDYAEQCLSHDDFFLTYCEAQESFDWFKDSSNKLMNTLNGATSK